MSLRQFAANIAMAGAAYDMRMLASMRPQRFVANNRIEVLSDINGELVLQ